MTDGLNSEDLKNYTAAQVAGLADVDHYAVRDEGFRRQDLADKKLEKLRKKLARVQAEIAAAQAEMAESAVIINAALAH